MHSLVYIQKLRDQLKNLRQRQYYKRKAIILKDRPAPTNTQEELYENSNR
jgi:hypothetical protein